MVAPFYLNDFILIMLRETAPVFTVYAAGYTLRFVVLAFVFLSTLGRWLAAPTVRYRDDSNWTMAIAVLAVVALDRLVQSWISDPLTALFPELRLFGFPYYDSNFLRLVDLTLGLALVAYSEELICRRIAAHVLVAVGLSNTAVVLVSALAFSLLHWSGGLGSLIHTFLTGAMLMAVYLRYRSLIQVCAIHYLINYLISGLW